MDPNTRTLMYDTLTTQTWQKRLKEVQDGVFEIHPFFDMLVKKGRIRGSEPVSLATGTHFEIPIRHSKMNQNFQAFGLGAEFGVAEKETLTTLYYPVKNLGTSMVRYWLKEQQNRSDAKIIDYVMEITDNTKESFEDELAEQFVNGSSDDLGITGITELISTTPTTGSIGGVTRSSHTILQNYVYDFTGKTIEANLVSQVTKAINDTSKLRMGNRTIDMIFTTQAIVEALQELAEDLRVLHVTGSDTPISLGMSNVKIHGIPVIWDPLMPEGQMLLLNTSTLGVAYDPDFWFYMDPWRELERRKDRYSLIISRCELYCKNFRKNAVIHSISTS